MTTYTGGYEWSEDYLFTGWGSDASDDEIEKLSAAVVSMFNTTAFTKTSSATWYAGSSEVVYDETEKFGAEHFEAWREASHEYVYANIDKFI